MTKRRSLLFALLLGVLVMAAWRGNALKAGDAEQTAAAETPVPPPPMGWSSWNAFSNEIDTKIAMAQGKAMVDSGMAKAGYQYINIDEGWWLGDRDAHGNIVVDPLQWPALAPGEQAGDMTNIVKYIHGLGLKAGIYTDAGEAGCSFYGPDLGPPKPHTGSEGHYEQDFLQFAKWGFDYVKVDWCGGFGENLDPAVQYAQIARAIAHAAAATGHRLFFSICNWGNNSPWTWAPGIGGVRAAIWRTSGDIVAPIVANTANANRKADFTGMLGNFDKGIHPEAEHTGYYNDPDMMVIGMPALTDSQNRVHMALWAISAAPLLVGADLTTLSAATLATLTNPDVIAVDQDTLGLQGVKVAGDAGREVWSKRLAHSGQSDARRAVVLLNRTGASAEITVRWADLGLDAGAAAVRDLWTHRDLGTPSDSYAATVPAEDALMLLISGHERAGTRYNAVAEPHPHPGCCCGAAASMMCGQAKSFRSVKTRGGMSWIQIAYTNAGTAPALASLQINGQIETVVAFPPTGKGPTGTVTIEAALKAEDNAITFSAPEAGGLNIDSIEVLPGVE